MKRVAEIKIKVIPLQPGSQPNTIFDNLTFSIMKRYYNTRKEARVAIEGTSLGYKVWRVTFGRHKGQYFVGTELEWFSI